MEKNIVCVESSLPIEEVIKNFIEESEQKNVVEFRNDKKQDISRESILLFDNYMNQSLSEELLNNSCDVFVRVTNFEKWKEVSSSAVINKLSLILQKGITTIF